VCVRHERARRTTAMVVPPCHHPSAHDDDDDDQQTDGSLRDHPAVVSAVPLVAFKFPPELRPLSRLPCASYRPSPVRSNERRTGDFTPQKIWGNKTL
jgi:hypothetical protein